MTTNKQMRNVRNSRRFFGKKAMIFAAGVVFSVAVFGIGADRAQAGGLGISLNLGCASINFSAGDSYPTAAPPFAVPAFPAPAPVVVAKPAPIPEPIFRPAPAPIYRLAPPPVPMNRNVVRGGAPERFAAVPNQRDGETPVVRGQAPRHYRRGVQTYSPIGGPHR